MVETHVDGMVEAKELCAVNTHRTAEKFIAALKKAALIFIIFEAVTAERLNNELPGIKCINWIRGVQFWLSVQMRLN